MIRRWRYSISTLERTAYFQARQLLIRHTNDSLDYRQYAIRIGLQESQRNGSESLKKAKHLGISRVSRQQDEDLSDVFER